MIVPNGANHYERKSSPINMRVIPHDGFHFDATLAKCEHQLMIIACEPSRIFVCRERDHCHRLRYPANNLFNRFLYNTPTHGLLIVSTGSNILAKI
jgi:hypothetical protein